MSKRSLLAINTMGWLPHKLLVAAFCDYANAPENSVPTTKKHATFPLQRQARTAVSGHCTYFLSCGHPDDDTLHG